MSLKNTSQSYGVISRAFHWLMAVGLVAILVVGFYMEGMPNSPEKFELYGLHKSFGIALLAFVVARFCWRQINLKPEAPTGMNKLIIVLAEFGHGLLYALMFAMPLVGWGMSSAGGHPVSFFGLFTVPPLVEKNQELGSLFHTLHGIGGWVFAGLIVAHILAALYHQFIRKDDVVKRMTRG